MKSVTLQIAVYYDPEVTDPHGVAAAMNILLANANTGDVLSDVGNPDLGSFEVACGVESTKREYAYDPPAVTPYGNEVRYVDVEEIDDDLYDIFDTEVGACLNEGSPFPFLPTKEQVREWITTGKIVGVME